MGGLWRLYVNAMTLYVINLNIHVIWYPWDHGNSPLQIWKNDCKLEVLCKLEGITILCIFISIGIERFIFLQPEEFNNGNIDK